ncbi:hypothetical protein NIES4071_16590 [Calothrix sp. NIES-4071]|nr:hypothetical protein NIES4071_16590 [Calothrix sp. NIES-4071]BAZ55993.1 hypothetical protein NIES4105_16540 [Calothrix sp. NIES-4105]
MKCWRCNSHIVHNHSLEDGYINNLVPINNFASYNNVDIVEKFILKYLLRDNVFVFLKHLKLCTLDSARL